jgi:hypothetical protein
MKTNNALNCLWKWFALLATIAVCAHAQSGGLNPGSKDAATAPKAVFLDSPENGKDPFFPHSSRRVYVPTKAVTTGSQVSDSSALFNLLQLKGISGTKTEPLAIINSATISEGEVADIRCGARMLKVRCHEIRSSSVIIELDGLGETRELKLRDNI